MQLPDLPKKCGFTAERHQKFHRIQTWLSGEAEAKVKSKRDLGALRHFHPDPWDWELPGLALVARELARDWRGNKKFQDGVR